MQAALLTTKASNQRGLLYPLLIIAAISVIIFSVLGAAAIAGWLPRADSNIDKLAGLPATAAPNSRSERGTGRNNQRAAAQNPPPIANDRNAACTECGVVASINKVEVKGQTNGLGMIAGGVTGALVGNQVGRGKGNALATVGGAAGGAFAGNELEKHFKKATRYEVRVRLNDGTYRTTYDSSPPGYAIGDKVKVSNGRVVKTG